MTTRRDLKAIEELLQSRGWAILKEAMNQDTATAVSQFAASATLPPDELHWRRGAIFAANKLQSLPETLKARMEAELTLQQASSAKAGQEKQT